MDRLSNRTLLRTWTGKRLIALLCLLVIEAWPLSGGFTFAAEQNQTGELSTQVTDEQVEALLKSQNLEFEKARPGAHRIKIGSSKAILFNDQNSLQFFIGFSRKVSAARINEWNRTKRYSRAYLDRDGDAVLETDLDLTGGVSKAHLEKFVQTFLVSAGAFGQFLLESK